MSAIQAAVEKAIVAKPNSTLSEIAGAVAQPPLIVAAIVETLENQGEIDVQRGLGVELQISGAHTVFRRRVQEAGQYLLPPQKLAGFCKLRTLVLYVFATGPPILTRSVEEDRRFKGKSNPKTKPEQVFGPARVLIVERLFKLSRTWRETLQVPSVLRRAEPASSHHPALRRLSPRRSKLYLHLAVD